MKIMHQYQPAGGSPARERDVFWLTPKNERQRADLQKFITLLRSHGVSSGWTGITEGEICLIEFPIESSREG